MQKSISIKEKENPPVESTRVLFDIMFVCNENELVEVVESSIIDFGQVVEQLRKGNSVFIAPKKHSSQVANQKRSKRQNNSFINHV